MDYEYIIIGAGVVGLAIAQHLSSKSNHVLLIERHDYFGKETSSRNSEVIHAGIYYPTDSLKAKLCVSGNQLLYEYCAKHKVSARRIGKFIIAVNREDEEDLQKIYLKARDNGVRGIIEVSGKEVNSEEPSIRAKSALFSRDTGIIDTHNLMQSFETNASLNGCDIAYRHTLKNIIKINSGYEISIEDPDFDIFKITSEKVINSAGLDSDIVAQAAGIDIDSEDYRIVYARGHYFRLRPGLKGIINHLIYPTPPKEKSSLGIHVTLELDGQLKLGPDVEYLSNRKQIYNVDESLKDAFYEAAQKYIISLEPDDIFPDQSGIRPKLQRKGEPPKDFIISEESSLGLPGLVNLIGIESPGLTSCLSIATYVESLF